MKAFSTANVARLSLEALKLRLATINSKATKTLWSVNSTDSSSDLQVDYKLRNFTKTWQFLNEVAGIAHEARHHPTITTTYNKVHILLTTHDIGNHITESDTSLADKIHEIYGSKYEVDKK